MNMTPDLAKLQIALDGDTDVIVRRDFSHPPARVWRVMTEPSLIPQWMASQDSMKRCEVDLRPGGSFRYEWDAFHFAGPILEVEAPHHMTHVEYFNGDTTSGSAVTTDLVAWGAGTRMTQLRRWPTAEARAAAIEMGMTDGYDDVYDKLEALSSAA